MRTASPRFVFAIVSTGIVLATLDQVRERFGSSAVTRAVLLGREERPELPLLPDA